MKQYGLYGFSVEFRLFPGYFCRRAEVSDPEAVLGQLSEGAAPAQDPQGLTSVALYPKENRQFFLGHLGLKSSLSPCRRESPHKEADLFHRRSAAGFGKVGVHHEHLVLMDTIRLMMSSGYSATKTRIMEQRAGEAVQFHVFHTVEAAVGIVEPCQRRGLIEYIPRRYRPSPARVRSCRA